MSETAEFERFQGTYGLTQGFNEKSRLLNRWMMGTDQPTPVDC